MDEYSVAEINEKMLIMNCGELDPKRRLIINYIIDNYSTVGTVFLSLNGSPPRGYAIYSPHHHIINYYDRLGGWLEKDVLCIPELDFSSEMQTETHCRTIDKISKHCVFCHNEDYLEMMSDGYNQPIGYCCSSCQKWVNDGNLLKDKPDYKPPKRKDPDAKENNLV